MASLIGAQFATKRNSATETVLPEDGSSFKGTAISTADGAKILKNRFYYTKFYIEKYLFNIIYILFHRIFAAPILFEIICLKRFVRVENNHSFDCASISGNVRHGCNILDWSIGRILRALVFRVKSALRIYDHLFG